MPVESTSVSEVARLRVLIADDQPSMRALLRNTLASTGEFDVVAEAVNGQQAVELATTVRPDVALIDLAMPVLDGVGAIRALRHAGVTTPVLVLTANGDRSAVASAIEAGADGYVLKGCTAEDLRAAVREVSLGGSVLAPAVTREVVQDYAAMIEEKRQRDLAVIRTLASAVDVRDRFTGDHIKNVAELSVALWEVIGDRPEEDFVYGCLLHDVGKIGVPDAVLLKDGRLTPDEMAIIRRHVEIGVDLVHPLGFRAVVTDIIRCHHERWDGRGYPNGLGGEEIPFPARVFSVVDAYDAMTSDRPYRRAMNPELALEELERHAGSQFDARCVEAFQRLVASRGPIDRAADLGGHLPLPDGG